MQNSTNMRILELLRFLYERTDEEKQDERVMISINEMLEEYVW